VLLRTKLDEKTKDVRQAMTLFVLNAPKFPRVGTLEADNIWLRETRNSFPIFRASPRKGIDIVPMSFGRACSAPYEYA